MTIKLTDEERKDIRIKRCKEIRMKKDYLSGVEITRIDDFSMVEVMDNMILDTEQKLLSKFEKAVDKIINIINFKIKHCKSQNLIGGDVSEAIRESALEELIFMKEFVEELKQELKG